MEPSGRRTFRLSIAGGFAPDPLAFWSGPRQDLNRPLAPEVQSARVWENPNFSGRWYQRPILPEHKFPKISTPQNRYKLPAKPEQTHAKRKAKIIFKTSHSNLRKRNICKYLPLINESASASTPYGLMEEFSFAAASPTAGFCAARFTRKASSHIR